MDFRECLEQRNTILMEGALGERLKREYSLTFDKYVAMARLIYDPRGAAALTALWNGYMDIAAQHQLPFIATTPTRRANFERIRQAGCTEQVIYDNVSFLRAIQQNSSLEMYVGGLMGCRGDAYTGADALQEAEARTFHTWQAEHFCNAGADFLYAGIMPTLPESAGMARAMEATGLPYIISFTVQATGRLIDGTSISDAIQYIDSVTTVHPICYMSNCVHPRILLAALSQPFNQNDLVCSRFRGIQANTSPLPYAELDGCTDLQCSEPEEFADEMMKLRTAGSFQIWGGCCGTDHRHMACIARKLQTP